MMKFISARVYDDYSSLFYFFDVRNKNDDILDLVKKATEEYLKTEEGRKIYEDNCNDFDLIDFDNYVPNSICEEFGFVKISTPEFAETEAGNTLYEDKKDTI